MEAIAAGGEKDDTEITEDGTSNTAAGNITDDVERLLLKKENAKLAIDRYKREIRELKERVTVLEKERTAYKEELETMFDYICEEEIDINKAVSILTEIYSEVRNNKRINKPIAYSLYHTWRKINSMERARKYE